MLENIRSGKHVSYDDDYDPDADPENRTPSKYYIIGLSHLSRIDGRETFTYNESSIV